MIIFVCAEIFAMLGAILGGSLGKSWRSMPKVGTLGTILMVPFMFAIWSY
jgi:hypothetical protein